MLYEPLPKRLRVDHYRGQSSWAGRLGDWFGFGRFGPAMRFAGVALLLMASGGGGWLMHDRYSGQEVETPAMSFARQAANAHLVFAPDLRHPVEFGADQQDSLLLWLSERLGEALHAPNLQDLGFDAGRRPAAAGVGAARGAADVREPDAQRITLYIRAALADPAERRPARQS